MLGFGSPGWPGVQNKKTQSESANIANEDRSNDDIVPNNTESKKVKRSKKRKVENTEINVETEEIAEDISVSRSSDVLSGTSLLRQGTGVSEKLHGNDTEVDHIVERKKYKKRRKKTHSETNEANATSNSFVTTQSKGTSLLLSSFSLQTPSKG